jgi:hypothetical protein
LINKHTDLFTRIELKRLVEVGLLMEGMIKGNRMVYWTWEICNNSDTSHFASIREILAPMTGLTEEEIVIAKNEAHRMEKAILILKMQIQNHPILKSNRGEVNLNESRILSVAEKHAMDDEIAKIEQDIGKYSSITKLLLDDIAEIHGTSSRQILLALNATRSAQNLLL